MCLFNALCIIVDAIPIVVCINPDILLIFKVKVWVLFSELNIYRSIIIIVQNHKSL
jgi:hypothetical protein